MSYTDPELRQFILEAHLKTYAATQEIKKEFRIPEADVLNLGHKEYTYGRDGFEYHDSYSGHIQAPGKEIIYYKAIPIWQMSYQGKIHSTDVDYINEVFAFLKEALRAIDINAPFRGLNGFTAGEFEYNFQMNGDLDYFTGRERILHGRKEIYFQDIMGCKII